MVPGDNFSVYCLLRAVANESMALRVETFGCSRNINRRPILRDKNQGCLWPAICAYCSFPDNLSIPAFILPVKQMVSLHRPPVVKPVLRGKSKGSYESVWYDGNRYSCLLCHQGHIQRPDQRDVIYYRSSGRLLCRLFLLSKNCPTTFALDDQFGLY